MFCYFYKCGVHDREWLFIPPYIFSPKKFEMPCNFLTRGSNCLDFATEIHYILTSKWVLCMQFAGGNHLFLDFSCFSVFSHHVQ